jgi:hypothetical protein
MATGWGSAGDIEDPCDECGCVGGHLPSCSQYEDDWVDWV